MGLFNTLFGRKRSTIDRSPATQGDAKYHLISTLPDGIEVTHNPRQVVADEAGRSGYRYTWLHRTSVKSLVGDLRITEFGSFSLARGSWQFSAYTGKPFTSEDFSDWYSCPDAKLVDGKVFSDLENWTGAEKLSGGSTLWYFIGEDTGGKKYKGVSQVDTLAQTE